MNGKVLVFRLWHCILKQYGQSIILKRRCGRRVNMAMDVNYLLHCQQMSLFRVRITRSQKSGMPMRVWLETISNGSMSYRRENEKLTILAH